MDCPACHHPNADGARFCARCGALLPAASGGSEDSLVGQVVGGRYRVTQLLGEGGMGRVYLAEQQMGTNVRKIAVKTLQSQYAKDQQVLARFHRECGTVSELEHPNTIQFFDFGQTADGQLYIAMEYVQGQSLSDALRHGPLQPDRVLRILAQICGSLEEAHGRGVVHRDLKPDNVILTTRAGQADFVKVLDFGIAKRSEAKDQAQEQKLTQQGMVLGTPPYMSPEQFSGKKLDARSDIYSLGVMAYEMLTGRLPFEAETPWQWATQHMTAQPFPFESSPAGGAVPAAMKHAILRALSKDPSQRQANVRQFYEELASAGSGVGASPALPVAHPSQGHGLPAHVQGPPQVTPYGGQTFPTSPQPQVSASARSGGGKGLVIALVSAAGLLAIALAVIIARQVGSKPEVAVHSESPRPAAATVAEKPPAPTPPDPAEASKPTTPVAPAITRKPTAAASAMPAPSAAPTPTQTGPVLTGDAACAEAKRLAENGDATAAVHVLAGCSGPGLASARAAIVRGAPDAVRRRIFNGDCAGAKALVAALSSIGAAAGAAAVFDAAPQCKK